MVVVQEVFQVFINTNKVCKHMQCLQDTHQQHTHTHKKKNDFELALEKQRLLIFVLFINTVVIVTLNIWNPHEHGSICKQSF